MAKLPIEQEIDYQILLQQSYESPLNLDRMITLSLGCWIKSFLILRILWHKNSQPYAIALWNSFIATIKSLYKKFLTNSNILITSLIFRFASLLLALRLFQDLPTLLSRHFVAFLHCWVVIDGASTSFMPAVHIFRLLSIIIGSLALAPITRHDQKLCALIFGHGPRAFA